MNNKYFITVKNYNGEFEMVTGMYISKKEFLRQYNMLLRQHNEAMSINNEDYTTNYTVQNEECTDRTMIIYHFDFNNCRTTLVEMHIKKGYRFLTQKEIRK